MARAYLVAGLPGSGKSHFSSILANELDLKVIDFDDNFDEFVKLRQVEFDRLGTEMFLASNSLQRYEDLMNRAVAALKLKKSIVIAAPFSKQIADQRLWDNLVAPIKKYDPKPTLYWIFIPDKLRKQRLISRGNDRDQEKIERIDQYISSSMAKPPVVEHTLIYGDQPFSQQLKGNV